VCQSLYWSIADFFSGNVCSGMDNEPLKQYKRPLMALGSGLRVKGVENWFEMCQAEFGIIRKQIFH